MIYIAIPAYEKTRYAYTLDDSINKAGIKTKIVAVDSSQTPQARAVYKELFQKLGAEDLTNGIRYGVAQSKNRMMRHVFGNGADFVATISADITMPEGWLVRLLEYYNEFGGVPHMKTEFSKSYCVKLEKGFEIDEGGALFGLHLYSKELFSKIGGYTEAYGYYGAIDHDFCARLKYSGIRYYYTDIMTRHIDDFSDREYVKEKHTLLHAASPIYDKRVIEYQKGNLLYHA